MHNSTNRVRLLIIDDNPAIHEDFNKTLKLAEAKPDEIALLETEALLFGGAEVAAETSNSASVASIEYDIAHAMQGEEAVAIVRAAVDEGRPFTLAFVDMRMPPGWNGVKTISELWKIDPAMQVVICSAHSDYSWNEIREELGDSDSLLILKKPFDNIEVLQIAANLARKWQLNEQLRAKIAQMEQMVEQRTAELRHSEERFATAFRAAPLPQAIQELKSGNIVDANQAFLKLIGYSKEDLVADSKSMLSRCGLDQPLAGMHPLERLEVDIRNREGETLHVHLFTQPTQLDGESHLLVMAQDVTRRRALEDQLRHSQKMEAVGQLAAGVAHDFNNILTIIQGHLTIQLSSKEMPAPLRESLTEVLDASERAAILTRQLLTFSRKHLFQPAPINLIGLLERQTKLLRRIVGEQIHLEYDCPSSSIGVIGDEPSLEQVLMNLVINARDAMPNGGKLRVSARPETVSGTSFANPGATAGDFVRIDVSDEGAGIDPSVLARIFEPFYTTKDVGCGTGMGLATVYGIVQQHRGWVDVTSDIGLGSTFSIFLPACEVTKAARRVIPEFDHPKLALQVLLVEDEPAVRAVMKRLLTHSGCSVIEAPDAHEGLRKWRENRDTIDLLVTDIVMPGGMSGHDLVRQIHSEAPDLKVIFCSGYSAELFGEDSELIPGKNFLPKPYSASSVVSMLHSVALG